MYKIFKRLFDIFFSLLALFILIPILFPISVLLKITSEREVFYLQDRIGLQNITFKIFKFATMLKNSEKMKGGIITLKNDPRVTFMGRFLRKSKINEFPQLINIIKGDMSIVGPRPVMKISFEAYPKEIQKVIYNVKPGLTGIGSIIFRDEEKLITNVKNNGGDSWRFYKEKIYPYKGELEIWYQKNMSLFLDIKIIMVTILVVIFPNLDISKWFKNLPIKKL